ncbi:MAG: hypothetical protein ACKVQW_12800, partial [Pyrinomonadaceae bacterium]
YGGEIHQILDEQTSNRSFKISVFHVSRGCNDRGRRFLGRPCTNVAQTVADARARGGDGQAAGFEKEFSAADFDAS